MRAHIRKNTVAGVKTASHNSVLRNFASEDLGSRLGDEAGEIRGAGRSGGGFVVHGAFPGDGLIGMAGLVATVGLVTIVGAMDGA